MPNTSEAHRFKIGNFHPTLLRILARKAAAIPGKLHRKNRYTANSVNRELSSWCACLSLSVLYCLAILLLTRCMDIEPNPGPCGGVCDTFMQTVQEAIENRFTQILQCLHLQNAALCSQLEGSFQRLDQTLKRIETDVTKLKQDVQQDRIDLSELLRDRDNAHTRLGRLERDMEKMDIASRQRNLKFLGIYESTRNDKTADIEELVGTLNYFSCDRKWVNSDVEQTHRIGPMSSASRRNPRPLIATFRHGDDKLAILRDRDLREALRQNGIRVAADLTPRQREEIQHYKKQGKTVYYKNGRLHVEDRWQQDNTNRYPRRHGDDRQGDTNEFYREPAQPNNHLDRYDERQTNNDGGRHDQGNNDGRRHPNGNWQRRDYSAHHGADAHDTNYNNWGDNRHPDRLTGHFPLPPLGQDSDPVYMAEQYHFAYNFPPALWTSTGDSHVTHRLPPTMPEENNIPTAPSPSTPDEGRPAAGNHEPGTPQSSDTTPAAGSLSMDVPAADDSVPHLPPDTCLPTAAVHQELPPLTAGETTQLGDEEEQQQPHDEGATRNQHQQPHAESTPNDAEQQEADGVKSPDREHPAENPAEHPAENPAENQLNRQGNTDGGSDHSSYADALKSPPPQTEAQAEYTPMDTPGNPQNVPQPSQLVAENARDVRPKPAQHRSSSTSAMETRTTRSKSQPRTNTSSTRQTSLHAAWQTAKDKTQK